MLWSAGEWRAVYGVRRLAAAVCRTGLPGRAATASQEQGRRGKPRRRGSGSKLPHPTWRRFVRMMLWSAGEWRAVCGVRRRAAAVCRPGLPGRAATASQEQGRRGKPRRRGSGSPSASLRTGKLPHSTCDGGADHQSRIPGSDNEPGCQCAVCARERDTPHCIFLKIP
jgi:hypothetical protein